MTITSDTVDMSSGAGPSARHGELATRLGPMVGFVLVALVVVWANRSTLLRTGSGSTDVLLLREPGERS